MAKSTAFNQKRRNANKIHRQKNKDRKHSFKIIGKAATPLAVPNVSKKLKLNGALKKMQRRMQHTLREQQLAKHGELTKQQYADMLDI
jgi:hypothetical protein